MKNIAKIIQLAKPFHKVVASISVLIVIGALVDLVNPFISKFVIDEITQQIQFDSGDPGKIVLLIFLGLCVGIFNNFLGSKSSRTGDHLAGELDKYLTNKFYTKILALPQSYFDSELSGKILNQLSRGISSISDFFNTATNFIIPSFLQAFFIIITLLFYSIPIALLTASIFPLYYYFTYQSAKKWGKEEEKKNKLEDETRGRINEVISNIKVVKSFTNEKNEIDFVNNKLTKTNKIYAKQSKTYHVYDFLRNSGVTIIMIGIYCITFYRTYLGDFSIGDMVLIIQLLEQARRPLFAMSFILTRIQTAEAGSKEYFEVMELENEQEIDNNVSSNTLQNPVLEFQNVNFHYKDSKDVVKNLNIKLGPNEKVALVGHSGAGKSTIVNLILKFYDPQTGEILLNNRKYTELDRRFIRSNIALVFQENELFSTTIKENVSYGSNAKDDQLIEALKKANAFEFVQQLPKGIDSKVGERGVKLSGGQKQRIQIARAILKNSPILILDEATSNLDSKSELEVQKALEELMKNKLVIIIAHRFSTIQNVDKIVVLEEGKMVDMGEPKELAQREGIYKELLQYQIEGNEKLLKKYELF